MHIQIANLRKLRPGNIGHVHSDCQSQKPDHRKPSDMRIRIANLRKHTPGNIGYAYSGCQS